jgi:hypothetical protein
MEQHGGFDYQPMSSGPAIGGTLGDLLQWAVPSQSQQDNVQAKDTQDDNGVRRSSRQGRGQTSKYKDYVQSVSYRDKYEQEWPVLGRRGASLVVT